MFYPLKKEKYCTKKKARTLIGCLVLVSCVIYAFVPWTTGIVFLENRYVCMPLPQFYDILTISTSIDTVIACILPSAIIVVLNVKIILQLQRHQTKQFNLASSLSGFATEDQAVHRRSLIHTSVSVSGSMHIRFSSTNKKDLADEKVKLSSQKFHHHRPLTDTEAFSTTPDTCQRLLRNKTQFRTARMLLILSSVFVLLNLPSHIFKVNAFFTHLLGSEAKMAKTKIIWQELFQLVYFLNFSINFFIYSMCGRQFRIGLVRLCRRLCQDSKHCDGQRNRMGLVERRQQHYSPCAKNRNSHEVVNKPDQNNICRRETPSHSHSSTPLQKNSSETGPKRILVSASDCTVPRKYHYSSRKIRRA